MYQYTNLRGNGLIIIVLLLFIYIFFWPTDNGADRRSILILPFQNMSASANHNYFSNGITEDLITQVSKIRDLKVISFKSSKDYKDSNKNLDQIGADLRVRNIVQGSVRRQENDVRITVKLVDVETDEILWAET